MDLSAFSSFLRAISPCPAGNQYDRDVSFGEVGETWGIDFNSARAGRDCLEDVSAVVAGLDVEDGLVFSKGDCRAGDEGAGGISYFAAK